MVSLYDIDDKLSSLIDEETGEILDPSAFDRLEMEKEKKIEQIALWIKNMQADAKAIGEERERLYKREIVIKNTIDRLKYYLTSILGGKKFTTAKCQIYFRKSSSVKIDDSFVRWAQENNRDDLLTYQIPTPSLLAIKEDLIKGYDLPAKIVTKMNIMIR